MILRNWGVSKRPAPATIKVNQFSLGQFCASHGAGLKETMQEIFSVGDPHGQPAHISQVVQERTDWLAAAIERTRGLKSRLNRLLHKEEYEHELSSFDVLYKNMADALVLTLVPDEGIKNQFLEQIKKQEILKRFGSQENDVTIQGVQKLGIETLHDLDWMKKYLEDKLTK